MHCVQMRFLEEILVVEVSKKSKCGNSLVICTALNKKRHFAILYSWNWCSVCCLWVWLCIQAATVNERAWDMHGFMWKVWTRADPPDRLKAAQYFIRNDLCLNAQRQIAALQMKRVRPGAVAKQKQRPGLQLLDLLCLLGCTLTEALLVFFLDGSVAVC